jgi:hypothetical protein
MEIKYFFAPIVKSTQKQKERWGDKKAGRVCGGNDVLALQCAKHGKKRKKRQGGLKLFFVLIYSLVFVFIGVHELATLRFWSLCIKTK